eukprot:g10948.t1
MLNTFAAWKIGAFEPQRVDKSALMFTNDRFAALLRCLEAFIEAAGSDPALATAEEFLREFRQLSTDLNTYTSKHRSAFQSTGAAGPGSMMTSHLERALDDDFATVTKAVGGVASELKNSFRDEPPGEEEVISAVPPVVFAKTRVAINDITGVHAMADMMRALGKGGGTGGSPGGGVGGSGSASKKQKTAPGNARAAQISGTRTAVEPSSSTVASLRASGCPFNTCRFFWDSGTCTATDCRFDHDQTKATAGSTAGGGVAARDGAAGRGKQPVRFAAFGTGGGFSTQQRDGATAGGDGGGSSGGGFGGGGGSGAGGFRRG